MKNGPPVAREAELLFRCMRGRPDSAFIRAGAEKEIDWARFVALAEAHGLSSLCCRRLDEACPELVPADARAALRHHLQRDAERNLFLTGELFRILGRLSEGGVPALAFKGPVLAWWLYGHPGVRRFQDLDILVHERDLARAKELLAGIGYGATPDVVRSTGQMSLVREAPPASIDLHWQLAPNAMGLALDARHLLPRATTVLVGGRPVLTFGVEDQVLLCAFHGGKHGWGNMAWLADLAALIETRPLDWPRLLAEARRKRLSRALFVGVQLVHDLLGTPLAAEIRTPLQRDTVSAGIAAEARAFLLDGPAGRRVFPRELEYELRLTEGLTRKASYFWHKVTEPSTQDFTMARSARPFRLMRKYAHRLAGLR